MLAQDPAALHETAEDVVGGMPFHAAVELQDHLMVAGNDLERLQRLIDDAGDALLGHFTAASGHVETGALGDARQSLGGAVMALQFHDMATQLIAHTSQRLRHCADRIAQDTVGDDEEGLTLVEAAPLRPNPVTQDEMDAGDIELF
jgi:hypothetical protein